ncbi:MAG: rRNA ((1518)-N(6)/adenine(1519)-N(6))-dimethyltransferase RsmA [Verrucomicrobiota bacterium]|jgi:16S rRNA (adenine1518-N6/adenine1519-N6)-dimethyltransferase
MSLTLSEIRRILDARGLQLTKSLGQNFLHDGNQLRRIVEAGGVGPGDRVLEIGPGLGPLTERLLERAGHVLAIEKDGRLVACLRERLAAAPNLELVEDDALEFLRRHPRDWSGWKLVANLPYSVASPILVELALAPQPPERMVATLQLEVAQRLAAAAGTDDYGLLTLLVQLRFEPRGWFRIPASCFFPAPDVDSACLTLQRRARPLLEAAQVPLYTRVVKQAFSQRRKMMLKLLKAGWPVPVLERAFAETGLDPGTRAERVTLEQFVGLTRALAAASPA